MIDLTEMNIMFTLNGEMLISDSGSEMAFKDIEIGDGKDLGYNVVYQRGFNELFCGVMLFLFVCFFSKKALPFSWSGNVHSYFLNECQEGCCHRHRSILV